MAKRPTQRARELLEGELREAVGDEKVDRADLDIDGAVEREPKGFIAALSESRLIITLIGAALIVAGVVASLALDNWLLLLLALGVHAIFTVIVISATLSTVAEKEQPAPTTVAALEAEGVRDPERTFNDLVDQVGEQDEDPRSEPTRPVGPGSEDDERAARPRPSDRRPDR